MLKMTGPRSQYITITGSPSPPLYHHHRHWVTITVTGSPSPSLGHHHHRHWITITITGSPSPSLDHHHCSRQIYNLPPAPSMGGLLDVLKMTGPRSQYITITGSPSPPLYHHHHHMVTITTIVTGSPSLKINHHCWVINTILQSLQPSNIQDTICQSSQTNTFDGRTARCVEDEQREESDHRK